MIPDTQDDLQGWHKSTLRVRYADTDRMGVVYHSNYFVYFEACRSDLIRQLWKPYSQIEKDGYFLLVIEAHCRFLRGAEYDDIIAVYAKISTFTDTRLHIDYKVFRERDNASLVEGYTVHCFTDHSGKPRRMPEDLKDILNRTNRKTQVGRT